MEITLLSQLKTKFDIYTRSFLTGNPDENSPHQLKIDHTHRVCDNIRRIGQSADLSPSQFAMAEAVALFHDIGRFEQYRRYQTFSDRNSVNHAALGVEILESQGFLAALKPEDKASLLNGVRFHNSPALPHLHSPESMLFIRLIRDADKLDIWKIFADHCRQKTTPEPAVIQNLSTEDTASDAIVDRIVTRKPALYQDMQTFTDFRLLQLSWVFDLEFPYTRTLADQRGELRAIADSLPDTEKIQQAVGILLSHPVEISK
ncbi:HD domain-containing protein [Desulfosarcina sp. OttesenSCG-928-G10]|nr:HD domain-containing protein [Desulfosarcina sp. OttesenSCG-928-G10]MDL2275257.1 HD domain-containing protein [Desulfosarcina sp. OttesenSCG-928-G10]